MGLLDCFLAPKLYVLDVAAKHFKLFTLDAARYPRLSLYRDMVFATAEFKADGSDRIHGLDPSMFRDPQGLVQSNAKVRAFYTYSTHV